MHSGTGSPDCSLGSEALTEGQSLCGPPTGYLSPRSSRWSLEWELPAGVCLD